LNLCISIAIKMRGAIPNFGNVWLVPRNRPIAP